MSDAAEVRALIAEARSARGGRFYGPISDEPGVIDLIDRLADALEAAHAEPDDNEREALAGTNAHDVVGRFAFDGAEGIAFHIYSDCSQEHSQARIMFDDLEDLKAFLTHNLPGLFGGERAAPSGDDDEREALARIIGAHFDYRPTVQAITQDLAAAGFRRSARVPVSRDELSRWLFARGISSSIAYAESLLANFDIYPKADRKPADSGEAGA